MRRTFVLAIVLCATLLPFAASAYVRLPTGTWAPAQIPVPYRMNESSIPAAIASGGRAAVQAGFASWSAPPCTTFRTTYAGTTALTAARPGDGENSILWRNGTWPPELGSASSVIGVTTPVRSRTGVIIDADIQFNNVGFRWSLDGRAGTVDTQSIAVHEEGHFLGLGHPPIPAAIMYMSYPGGVKRNLHGDDAMGVCALYPTGTTVGCTTTSMCAPGQECVMGSCRWVVPDGGTSMGRFGEACSMLSPCMTGGICVCRSATDCFCTRMCTTASPCPGGYRCVASMAGNICVPGANGATGDSCRSGLDCASNICITTTSGGVCSEVCIESCSCPPDMTCQPRGGGGNFCLPGVNDCTPGADAGPQDVVEPPDAAPEMDSGPAPDAASGDAGATDTAGDRGPTVTSAGCRCRAAAATSRRSARAPLALALAFAAIVSARRRSRSRRDEP